MMPYCSRELKEQMDKQLRLYLWGAAVAAVFGLLLEVAAAVLLPVTWLLATAMGLFTAALSLGLCALFQGRILPLSRTRALLEQLRQGEEKPFSGISRGIVPGKTVYAGVMMYRLRLDEGKRLGKEPICRELYIPGVFGQPRLAPGTPLEGRTVEGVLVALDPAPAPCLDPAGGRYRVPGRAVLLCLASAALLWAGLFTLTNQPAPESRLNIAVCAPAHHDQTQEALSQGLRLEGIEPVFSYTNTLDPEAVATYLATFGALDADILILNGDHFSGIFDCETHPLDARALTAGLGFAPRFVTDAAGRPTGVYLYLPEDPAYNACFPGLPDWIAVEREVALVAALGPGSVHAPTGKGDLALLQLLTGLCH